MKMATAIAVACLSVGLAAGQDVQAVVRHYDLNIPKQSLDRALRDLAQQTGLQIALFSDSIDSNAVVGAIQGNQSAEEALNTLLTPSGLSYKVVSEGTIAVLNPKEAPPAVVSPKEEKEEGNKKSFFDRLRISQVAFSDFQGDAASENAQAAAPSSERDSGDKLEEIVVTAQRREERLADVPISISVLKGGDLDQSSVVSLMDTLNQVPGVVTTTSFGGLGGQIKIRGVGLGNPDNGGGATTAYYIDGAPFSRGSSSPDLNAYDLQRVEVLRGPQGTLFGTGGVGGVVRIITNDANVEEFEAKARTVLSSTEGGGENYGGDAAINIPLVDGKVAVRGVVGYRNWSGWVDGVNNEDINDSETQNYRLKLALRPDERLSIDLSSWISQFEADGFSTATDDGRTFATREELLGLNWDLHSLRVGYEFPGVSLTSNTSYFDSDAPLRQDYSRFVGAESPIDILRSSDNTEITQELGLASTGDGPWRWTLGAFYKDAESSTSITTTPDPNLGVPLFVIGDFGTSTESAAFGELTRLLMNDRLEVTVGARYYHNEQTANSSGIVNSAEFDKVTHRFVLSWHASPDFLAYASYAEGFRPGILGSVQAGIVFPPADPDLLKTYETGFRGDLWRGLLSFDVAAYYMRWEDTQISQTYPLFDGQGGLICYCLGAYVNAGPATGPGVDVGLTLRPTDNLTLNGSVSWNDLRLHSDILNGDGTALTLSAGRLPFSSEYTVSGSVNYSFPITSTNLTGELALAYVYQSEQEDFSTGTQTRIVGDPVSNLNASFSVRADNGWAATLFANNFTDEDGATPYSGPTLDLRPRARPRTIGVQFSYALR